MTTASYLILGTLAGLNLLSFLAFAWDKHRAIKGASRTSESRLHIYAFLGGLGAIGAIYSLRHKNRKGRFLISALPVGILSIVWQGWLVSQHFFTT